MEIVKLEAQTRNEFGKKPSKLIRKEGLVPAVIYGKDGVSNIALNTKSLKPLVYTPDFKIAEVSVDGKVQKCILKDIAFHPVSDEILHLDFIKLLPNVPLNLEVPLHFKGTSPGVKAGGKLIEQLRKIAIRTTPEKIVDKLYVDISKMELGQSVRVRDVEIPDGIAVTMSGATPVALIEIPRALKSAAAAEAKKDAASKKKK